MFLSLLTVSLFFVVVTSAEALLSTSSGSCSCTEGRVAVKVDVQIATDPSDGKFLNSTTLRPQQTTFQIFGILCQPAGAASDPFAPVQLLLHGQTYTNQYWHVQWNGFQNYSYVDFSCSQGVSSFAYDNICAGKSSHPTNSNECQIPSAAAVVSSIARKLKDGSLAAAFTDVPRSFSKIFGIGHSLGSSTLNYAAIVDGKTSPFAGFVFTGSIHDPAFLTGIITNLSLPAQGINPIRWGHLDPGYVTSPSEMTRTVYYGPQGSFDPTLLQLDFLTEDVGSRWLSLQIKNIYAPTTFTGPITVVIGQLDKVHCLTNNNTPCDQVALQTSEKFFFPNADFKAIVINGQGHDLNYGFGAVNVFPLILDLFKKVTK